MQLAVIFLVVLMLVCPRAHATEATTLTPSLETPEQTDDNTSSEAENKATIEAYQEHISSIKPEHFTSSALLQGLDKITTHISTLPITIGETIKFSNLEISLLSCWQAPIEDEPESKALLEIWEHIPGEKKKQLFYGWMLATSSGLSALEHPIYDVTLLSCTKTQEDKLPPTMVSPHGEHPNAVDVSPIRTLN